MNSALDFLLSPEATSLIHEGYKTIGSPAFSQATTLLNNRQAKSTSTKGFTTIDYSKKSASTVLYDIVGMLASHFQKTSV